MLKLRTHGWIRLARGKYRHCCGARVLKERRLWTAIFVDGSRHEGHRTAKAAANDVQTSDPLFWGFDGRMAFSAPIAGIMFHTGMIGGRAVFVAYTKNYREILPFVEGRFRKRAFGVATCVKCGSSMQNLTLKPNAYCGYDNRLSKGCLFAVCECGCPAWHEGGSDITIELRKALNRWERQERVRNAEGHYTDGDVNRLYRKQKGCCCYCGETFTKANGHTVDHVVSLAVGGSHWPSNLRLACRKCNSAKGAMSAHEFILLKQDEQINQLKNEGRRLRAQLKKMQEECRQLRS
jgi:5-methylcytosine-specific restriction endonuclease McrA